MRINLLTKREYARRMRIAESTVHRRVIAGKLDTYLPPVGRREYIKEEL